MHNKTQRKNDGNEEFDSPTKDDLLPEKLQRPEDPLAEALKFLQPLQQLASNDLSTHLFAFEIYYRKGSLHFMLSLSAELSKMLVPQIGVPTKGRRH